MAAKKKRKLAIPFNDQETAQAQLRKSKERSRRGFKSFSRRERLQEVKQRASGSKLKVQTR